MTRNKRSAFVPLAALVISAALTPTALAQSNVSAAHKFSWGENIGWMNWRDAGSPVASQGARVHPSFLSGFIWGENIGWINLGDGAPANGTSYANATGADFGVNRGAGNSALTGVAWGENIGWVNFTLPTLPAAQQPRFDAAAGRLRGYAWGENVGWINLDDANVYVGVFICGCDWNQNAKLNSQDFFDFLADMFAGNADYNADGVTNSQDFFDFLVCFFGGC